MIAVISPLEFLISLELVAANPNSEIEYCFLLLRHLVICLNRKDDSKGRVM